MIKTIETRDGEVSGFSGPSFLVETAEYLGDCQPGVFYQLSWSRALAGGKQILPHSGGVHGAETPLGQKWAGLGFSLCPGRQ